MEPPPGKYNPIYIIPIIRIQLPVMIGKLPTHRHRVMQTIFLQIMRDAFLGRKRTLTVLQLSRR